MGVKNLSSIKSHFVDLKNVRVPHETYLYSDDFFFGNIGESLNNILLW